MCSTVIRGSGEHIVSTDSFNHSFGHDQMAISLSNIVGPQGAGTPDVK